MSNLKMLGLELDNIHGQGYDGASNMSSVNAGVQEIIKNELPSTAYLHCSGHCLNFVIARSCSLTNLRNVIDEMNVNCSFFFFKPENIWAVSFYSRELRLTSFKTKGFG